MSCMSLNTEQATKLAQWLGERNVLGKRRQVQCGVLVKFSCGLDEIESLCKSDCISEVSSFQVGLR